MLQMSRDQEGTGGGHVQKKKKKNQGGQICRTCGKSVDSFSSGKMIRLQSGVLLFGLVLNKEWKRAEVSRVLGFCTFVLLFGAQGAFDQPFCFSF